MNTQANGSTVPGAGNPLDGGCDPVPPATVDDLTFTARDGKGHMIWWAVEAPVSESWDDHVSVGESCAKELLALLSNPFVEPGTAFELIAFIDLDMQANPRSVTQGVRYGFFSEISRVLSHALQ